MTLHTEFNERSWLAWLVKVRIIIITFLLGIELAVANLTPSNTPVSVFLSLIALWYTIAVFFVVLQHSWREVRLQSLLQILTDLLFATAVIYVSGGIDTYFNFLFPLIIIVASILLPRWWAYLTAALSFILFGGVLELSYFEIIRSYSTTKTDLKSLQAVIFINLFAYMAIAYLASNLATKLRQADVQLKSKSGALEDLQALHENIINSMRGGLITTNLEGRVTFVNAPGQAMLQRDLADMYGLPVSELFLDRLPGRNPAAAQAEARAMTPVGEEKVFGVTYSPLTVPDRGEIGQVYTFADLTDIRRLEREVRMRDRLAAVGRMAAGIAHEIRNPLASISGSVQVLSSISNLSPEQRTLVSIVTRESQRLNKIVSDFLIYSRDKSYDIAENDLIRLLEDTLTLLGNREAAAKVTIVRNFVPAAPALVDGDKMKQVFWNICENAMRAMPEGGTLAVSVTAAEAESSAWLVSFRDTGPGLTPQQAEKIFEPFQSTFDGGTGLGLAIVYQILNAHGAKVTVNSRPGEGAEFVLEIKRGIVQGAAPAKANATVAGAVARG